MPERVGIERTRELLEDRCLMDDALFSKCFSEDTVCTKLILDIILGRNDLTVTEVHIQRWIQNIQGHSVKLDIAARDAEGNLYDIEIQRVSDDSIRKRARFYSAMIDADKFNDFWKEFSEILPKIKAADFTNEELSRAKLNIEDSLFRSKETISGIASKAGYFFMQSGSLNAERDYLNSLHNVSLDDIGKAINMWFKPEALTLAALTPEGFTAPDLKGDLLQAWPLHSQSEAKGAAEGTKATEIVEIGPGQKLILIPDNTLPYISLNLAFTG